MVYLQDVYTVFTKMQFDSVDVVGFDEQLGGICHICEGIGGMRKSRGRKGAPQVIRQKHRNLRPWNLDPERILSKNEFNLDGFWSDFSLTS